MNPLNLLIVEGNACRDSELKHSSTGTAICKISLAVNRFYKSGDKFEKEVSFFDVDTFGEVAKLCADKVKKGDEIRVTGRLKQNRWSATDGVNRSTVVIVGDRVEFRQKNQSRDGQTQDQPQAAAAGGDDGFSDDIPF